jgi:hypothetical protein
MLNLGIIKMVRTLMCNLICFCSLLKLLGSNVLLSPYGTAQTNPDGPGPPARPRKASGLLKLLAMSAVLSIAATASPVASQTTTTNCLLPEAFNPYFQHALDEVSATFETHVVQGLKDIGLGPIASLSINDLMNFKEHVFDPLFGDEVQRNGWINVTTALDVKTQLESNLNNVIGSIPKELSMRCDTETTDDLEEDELPYRFAMTFVLSGRVLGTDLELASLSPSIAVLPEDTFDPLSLSVQTLSADYEITLPLTLDTKRRKFMIGEITITFGAALSSNVLQSIPLTDTVSQNFQGTMDVNAELSFSSISDWAYTASFDASLKAATSDGTAVAELGLIAQDDDLFDDKPRELSACDCRVGACLLKYISLISLFRSSLRTIRLRSLRLHQSYHYLHPSLDLQRRTEHDRRHDSRPSYCKGTLPSLLVYR